MTTGSTPALGLPGDIDADPATIRSGAESLVELRLSLTGQTEETDAGFRSSAGEFTDLVAWDITTAAADELILWEDTTRDLTYGAATLKQWAQDIEDYRAKRTSIEDRFNTALAEIDAQMGRANWLVESANDAAKNDEHAVVSWIGYDAPNFAEAAGTGRAEGAVDELNRFQDGLRATHENTTQSNNTVIGHTAQSEAGLNADEIVLVGSPGADAQHASELRFPPANVHATTAKNDGITGFTDLTHGADPTNPEFGATVFDSNPGSSDGAWPLRDAHSEYFQEDNSSLEYMSEAIAGQNKSG